MGFGVENGLFNTGWFLKSTYGAFFAFINWWYLAFAFILRGVFGKLVGNEHNTWHHNQGVYEDDEVQQKF